MAKEKKVWDEKRCIKCRKYFIPNNNRQIFCGVTCCSPKKKSIAEANAAWALQDLKPKKRVDQRPLKNCGCRVI